jgi:hypothetical protein
MNESIHWSDESEVAARLVEQFGVSLARLIALYDRDGRYDELVSGYRAGRTSFALSRVGLTVLENTDIAPPSGN